MAEPFLAEVRMMGFNFAPRGWAFCDGQILPINQNQSLFSLMGTTFGGDGRTSFALPDMRGRTPVHVGQGANTSTVTLGQKGGQEGVTLTVAEMPSHTHNVVAAGAATTGNPAGNFLGESGSNDFSNANPTGQLAAVSVTSTGGGQPHTNMQPFTTVSFCIALRGLFPSRN